MKNLKYVAYALLLSIIIYSCGSDDTNDITPFDHKAQALKDSDTLVAFFKNHYFNTNTKKIESLAANATPLSEDTNLDTIKVNLNDIDYNLYYYKFQEGTTVNPKFVDSVLVKYDLRGISNSKTITDSYQVNTGWFDLLGTIPAWKEAIVKFKGGEKNTLPNGPLSYHNTGQGVLFIPSGLAYKDAGRANIPSNAILLYYIDLWDSKHIDHDGDSILTIHEMDSTKVGDEALNIDTDGDGVKNFADNDDDNDFIPTRYEDKNKNGDPTDDKSDANKPDVPDYLNRDIRLDNRD